MQFQFSPLPRHTSSASRPTRLSITPYLHTAQYLRNKLPWQLLSLIISQSNKSGTHFGFWHFPHQGKFLVRPGRSVWQFVGQDHYLVLREGRSLHLFNVGLYCPLSQRQGSRGRQSRLNTALNVLDFARFSHSQSWVASWINAQCSGNYFRYNPGQDLTMTRAGHVPRRPQYQAHRQSAQRKLQGNNVLRWLGNRYFSLASFIMAIMWNGGRWHQLVPSLAELN